MQLVKENPFRILGLVSNASEREIHKQIATIKRFAEVGKTKDFEYDFTFLGGLNRDLQKVSEASRKIEKAQNKLLHSLFWFVQKSPVDKLAIDHLKKSNVDKAIDIWSKTLTDSAIAEKNYSSYSNLSTLYLVLSMQNGEVDLEKFNHAISLKGKLINSNYLTEYSKVVAGDIISPDPIEINKSFIDQISIVTQKYINSDNGMTHQDLLRSFSSFPDQTTSYLSSKFIEEPIYNIESRIDSSIEKRKIRPEDAGNIGTKLYKSTKDDLSFLRELLSEDDIQYQQIANKLSHEVLQCAIDFFNENNEDPENDPGEIALALAKKARRLATDTQTMDRIDENLKIIQKWVDKSEKRNAQALVKNELSYVAVELEHFQDSPFSIDSAIKLITTCKPKLYAIKEALGVHDPFYLEISSAVGNNALSMVVACVNRIQEGLEYSLEKRVMVPGVIADAVRALNMIGELDMEDELLDRYRKNHQIINSISNQIKTASMQSNSGSSGCYIATMAYGDYKHPQVKVLREFRDRFLWPTTIGRTLVKFYYWMSPSLVAIFKDNAWANNAIRRVLDCLISKIKR